MSYAIISLGGKQYTVREGQRLLVDRLGHDEGKTFTPQVLLVGGDGETKLSPTDVTVTAKVLGPASARRSASASTGRRAATGATPASARS